MRARWLAVPGALSMVLASASCAKGTGYGGFGGSGEGASSPSSSSGSTSSSSGSTSSSSGSTSSSSGSTSSSSGSTSSSSGSSCPDTPCKLTTPQCGCGAGEGCVVAQGAVACGQVGSDANLAGCGTSATDLCQQGLACVTASSSTGQCLKFCDTDSNCAAFGGICVIELDDGNGGSIPGVTLCTPGCDPISTIGCPSTSSCQLGRENAGLQRWFGICGPAGTKTQGVACSSTTNDCAPGYTCIDPGTGYQCMRYCDADAVVGCPNALTCYPLQDQLSLPIVLDGVTMGVCF